MLYGPIWNHWPLTKSLPSAINSPPGIVLLSLLSSCRCWPLSHSSTLSCYFYIVNIKFPQHRGPIHQTETRLSQGPLSWQPSPTFILLLSGGAAVSHGSTLHSQTVSPLLYTSVLCIKSYSFSLMLMSLVVFRSVLNLESSSRINLSYGFDTPLSPLLRICSFKYYFIPLYFQPLQNT